MRLLTAMVKSLLFFALIVMGAWLLVEWTHLSERHGWTFAVCIAPLAIVGFAIITAGFYKGEKQP